MRASTSSSLCPQQSRTFRHRRASGRQQVADFIQRKADLLRLLDDRSRSTRFRPVKPKPPLRVPARGSSLRRS